MTTRLGPTCGRRIRGRYAYCTSSRLRRGAAGYAPACARCLTGPERASLGLAGGTGTARASYPDIAKLRAGDRD